MVMFELSLKQSLFDWLFDWLVVRTTDLICVWLSA